MAKKSARGRRMGRKYRVARRVGKKSGGRGFRPYAKKVHWFKEVAQIANGISANAGSNGTGVMTFKLDDLNNQANFAALFDLYKITGVKIKIVPRFNVSDPTTVANANTQAGTLPMLYIAENRDPYVPAPINVADILNDDGVKVIRLTRPINLWLKSPKPLISGGNGVESIPMQFGTGRAFQPWLTTGGNGQTVSQIAVPHYGFRWLLNNGVGNFTVVCDVYATYYFAMKEQD